ncbi:hypothetical protein IAR50_003068 [Cryptococcus sp. DSM 104548]
MLTNSLTLLTLIAFSIVSSRPIDLFEEDTGSVTGPVTDTYGDAEKTLSASQTGGRWWDDNGDKYETESVSYTRSAVSAHKSVTDKGVETVSASASLLGQQTIETSSASASTSATALSTRSRPITSPSSVVSATPALETSSAQSSSSFSPTPTPSSTSETVTHSQSQSHSDPSPSVITSSALAPDPSLGPSATPINSTFSESAHSIESFADRIGMSLSTFIIVFVGTVIALLGIPLLMCLAPAVKRGHVANKEWKGKRLGSESSWSTSGGSSLRTESALDSCSRKGSSTGSSAGSSDKIPQVDTPSTLSCFTPTIVITDRDLERGPFEFGVVVVDEKGAMKESRA